MKINLMCAAISSALVFMSSSASAEEDMYREAWYALPGINYNWIDSDVKAGNDVGGFIRFGKEAAPNWDVQVGFSHNNTDEDSSLSTRGHYKQTLFGVDALYVFSRDKFRPFLLAGVGYAKNTTKYSDVAWGGSKESAMGNLGGGFQYLVNDKLGFQADIREVWSKAETGVVGNRDSEMIADTQINLGVIYRFGSAVAKKVPQPVAQQVVPQEPVKPQPEPVKPQPEPVKSSSELCKPKVETMTLSASVLFGFNDDVLSGEGKTKLNDIAKQIKQHDDIELIMVSGYSDRIGNAAYNQKLSEKRAAVVKNYLVTWGVVDAGRLKSVGMGANDSIVACEGVRGKKKLIECLAPNRRVIVEAIYTQESGCGE